MFSSNHFPFWLILSQISNDMWCWQIVDDRYLRFFRSFNVHVTHMWTSNLDLDFGFWFVSTNTNPPPPSHHTHPQKWFETHNGTRHGNARHGTGLRGDNNEHRDGLSCPSPKMVLFFFLFTVFNLILYTGNTWQDARRRMHDMAQGWGDNDEHGDGLSCPSPKMVHFFFPI